MKDVEKFLLPFNLQMFAEGDGEGAEGGEGDGAGAESGGEGNQDLGEGAKTGETFTQEQVNAIAAREKSQGRSAVFKMFGVKDEKAAKEQAEAFKKWQESQKDTEQKLKDAKANASDAEKRALAAEAKCACMAAGVQKESIDDALAIASLKVTDDKGLDAVLEEMKKEPRYQGFFGTSSKGSSGTGTPDGHQGTGKGGSAENIGARLGKSFSTAPKKSNFFTN